MVLLPALAAAGDVSAMQVFKGFHRLVVQLDDLALDMPHLQASFRTLRADAVAAGVALHLLYVLVRFYGSARPCISGFIRRTFVIVLMCHSRSGASQGLLRLLPCCFVKGALPG